MIRAIRDQYNAEHGTNLTAANVQAAIWTQVRADESEKDANYHDALDRASASLFTEAVPSVKYAPMSFVESLPADMKSGFTNEVFKATHAPDGTDMVMKLVNVPIKTQEAMVRQSVQELMREVGGRGYEKYYIPPAVYAKLSPDEQKRADMLNKILTDLANRAKARAKMVKEPAA
jgi:hypothetical protein